MKASPIKKFVLPSILLSGAVFSALTLPLAVMGSEDVLIQLKDEPFFYGKVKDIAAPYLGLATAISMGVAVSSVAVTGWRQSSRKSAQVEQQLFQTQENLHEKEVQLEQIKVSQPNLEASGLAGFIDEPISTPQTLASVDTSTILDSQRVPHSEQAYKKAASSSTSVLLPITNSQQSLFSTRTGVIFADAPTTVLQANVPVETEVKTAPIEDVNKPLESEALKQVKELQTQFQYMTHQIELIQQLLFANSQQASVQYSMPNYSNVSVAQLSNNKPSRKSRRQKKLAS